MTDPTPLPFVCRKAPASGSAGVVVTNHPLGSAAGHEIMAAGAMRWTPPWPRFWH